MNRLCFRWALAIALTSLTMAAVGQPIVQLDRIVVASSGTYAQTGNLSLSFTVGEPATLTAVTLSGSLVVTMGFQQPVQDDLVGIQGPVSVPVEYEVFPNPTSGLLFLKLSSEQPVTLTVDVLDARGRHTSVPSQRLGFVGTNETIFNFSSLADGIYLLRVRELEGKVLKTLKIQKVQ
jgi:hypothetical protein